MKTLFFLILIIVAGAVELLTKNVDEFHPAATQAQVTRSEAFPTETEEPDAIIRPVSTEPPTIPTAGPVLSGTSLTTLFGDPKITDNFERGSSGFGINAGLNDDDTIRIIALNNRLSLEPKKNNGWITWRLRPPVQTDGAAEMEFSLTTCARGDRTGVIMHAPDYNSGQGYYFSLACEGTVSILRDSTIIASADVPELFRNASGDVNIMTAVIMGNTLTAMLNGQTAVTVQDDKYPSGFSGFFTAPQGDRTLTMDVISFTEYSRN